MMVGDGEGLPAEVLESWKASGGIQHHLRVAQSTAAAALNALDGEDQASFAKWF